MIHPKFQNIEEFPFSDTTQICVELTEVSAWEYITYVREIYKNDPIKLSLELLKAQLLATSGVKMTFAVFRQLYGDKKLMEVVEAVLDVIKK